MSALLVASAVAAIASVIATACVAYILISFRLNGHLLASRTGQQPLTVVLAAAEGSRRRRRLLQLPSIGLRRPRLQPI